MTVAHRDHIVRETVMNVVLNMAFSVAFFVPPFYGRLTIDWWGARGLALDFLPQIAFVVFAAWLAPSLTTAHRLRTGKIAAVSAADIPGTRTILVRSLLIALGVTVALGALCIALVALLGLTQIGFVPALILKTVFGGLIALIAVPIAVRSLLRTAQPQIQR